MPLASKVHMRVCAHYVCFVYSCGIPMVVNKSFSFSNLISLHFEKLVTLQRVIMFAFEYALVFLLGQVEHSSSFQISIPK